MKVRKKPGIELEATKLTVEGQITTDRGEIQHFEPGDYLMQTDSGEQWVISADYYAENYETVTEY